MSGAVSDYLKHLPELFRDESPTTGRSFVGEYLKVFEALLSGRTDAEDADGAVVSLEARIDRFLEYLDPRLVPTDDGVPSASLLTSEFLSYLAEWVALTLDQNWDMAKKRLWLSRIVPLYKRRGTLRGIQEYLEVFVGNQAAVQELPGGMVIAETSTVGEDTFIAGAPAYYFRVRIAYAFGSTPFEIDVWNNVQRGTRAIVDLEKPAHTYYTLDARTPGFIVAERSTVGADTLLWSRSRPFT